MNCISSMGKQRLVYHKVTWQNYWPMELLASYSWRVLTLQWRASWPLTFKFCQCDSPPHLAHVYEKYFLGKARNRIENISWQLLTICLHIPSSGHRKQTGCHSSVLDHATWLIFFMNWLQIIAINICPLCVILWSNRTAFFIAPLNGHTSHMQLLFCIREMQNEAELIIDNIAAWMWCSHWA